MPKQKAITLISDLHDRFGDDEQSAEQKQLLDSLQQHIHELGEEDAPEPDFIDALEVLVTDTEVEHPAIATVLRTLVDTLKNIGV
jgi:uncharacterized coiled-coil protein SlyX